MDMEQEFRENVNQFMILLGAFGILFLMLMFGFYFYIKYKTKQKRALEEKAKKLV